MLHKSDTDAQLANQSLIVWEAETNQTLKDSLEAFFLEAKNNYTSAIADAKARRAPIFPPGGVNCENTSSNSFSEDTAGRSDLSELSEPVRAGQVVREERQASVDDALKQIEADTIVRRARAASLGSCAGFGSSQTHLCCLLEYTARSLPRTVSTR